MVNKREILQSMLDKIEAGWWIKKPSPLDPGDIEWRCTFQHHNGYRNVDVEIPTSLFEDGKLAEIERIVTAAIKTAPWS